MAAKIEPIERQSAGAAAGSDEQSDQQLRAILENLQHVMKEDGPVEKDDLRPTPARAAAMGGALQCQQYSMT